MSETVVLVHGVLMNGRELTLLARRLRQCGFNPVVFDYPSRQRHVEQHAKALVSFIEGLQVPLVHLVGHSLGGLVILRALEMRRDLPPGRVVLLGTPVRGSGVARGLKGKVWGRWLLGRSAEGGLLEGAPDWDGLRELGIIAGRTPLGVGALLGGLSGVHDGTVAVEETRLDGACTSVVLDTTHTGLVFSRPVAERVCCFLKDGHFDVPATSD
jgi:pimeloyl-ACP methyl ester carboxylesterase